MRPVHAGPLIDAFGDVGSVNPEFAEETGQNLCRVLCPGARPAQVGVELPVGELVTDPVRDVNRERRLPDAGLT